MDGVSYPSSLLKKEEIIKIVKAGTLAPSGDNSQPWRVYFDGKKLYLKNLQYRDRSLYNVRNIASYVAFGAMIENMIIMAKSLGYDTSIELFPHSEKSSIVAILSFIKAQVICDPLLPYINKRCVNRKKYKLKKLEPRVKESLLKVIKDFKEAELYIVEDDREKKKLAKILSLNDRILFENKNLHHCLFNYLRWSEEEIENTKDGMGVRSLELGNIRSKMFRLLSSWNLVRCLNIFGFSRIIPLRSYNLCKSSSALCMLLMKDLRLKSFVEGGRVFQRIWLTATSLDLSLQPMTGITFLIQRLHMANGKDLSITHQRLLMDLEKQLKSIFPINRDKLMIMAFRLGYADPPSDKSLRLPVNRILIEGDPKKFFK